MELVLVAGGVESVRDPFVLLPACILFQETQSPKDPMRVGVFPLCLGKGKSYTHIAPI